MNMEQEQIPEIEALTNDEKRILPMHMQVNLLMMFYGSEERVRAEAHLKGGWVDRYSIAFRKIIDASLVADPNNNFLTRYKLEPEPVLKEIENILYAENAAAA